MADDESTPKTPRRAPTKRAAAAPRTTTPAKKAPAKRAPAKAAAAKRAPAKAAPAKATVKATVKRATKAAEAAAPAVDERPVAIEVTGLRRSFKGDVDAVRGIDLEVREGEVFGFLGPNGAGKTTTVRMLCTLLPPTGGSAKVAGLDVVRSAAKVRHLIGVALQEIGLDPLQTARELLELQCGLYGMSGPQAKKRTTELLELVGISEAADRRLKTFSGGMKRRADLASALVHSPKVLFLDEPTTGLDPASRLSVWEEVRRINESGTTVFLTTQYLEEADALCDRLAIIDNGVIVAEGTPTALKAEMGHDVVTLALDGADLEATKAALKGLAGLERTVESRRELALYLTDGASAVPDVVRRLDRAAVRVGAISVSRPTLDDVFLKATGRRLEGDDATARDAAEQTKGDAA